MNCNLCKRELNQPQDPTTKDCGGDCLLCMAQAGDPDCEAALRMIRRKEGDNAWVTC